MAAEFRREALLWLPMPLAQLYRRAFNARQELARITSGFAFFEVLIELSTAVAVMAYLEESDRGRLRSDAADEILARFEPTRMADWVELLASVASHFGDRPDAAKHPLGNLAHQLQAEHADRQGLLALRRRVDHEPGSEGCSILQIFHALAKQQADSRVDETLSEQELEPALLSAINDLLEEGTLDPLGPAEARLVHLADVRTVDDQTRELEMRELVGAHGERLDPVTVTAEQAEDLVPDRVGVLWPNRPAPLLLAPLLHYREGELTSEVLVFRGRGKNDPQLLSHLQNDMETVPELGPSLAAFTSNATGAQMDQGALHTIQDFTPVITELAGLEPHQIRLRLLDVTDPAVSTEWLFQQGDEISIGREGTNNVQLDDRRVSRCHAVVVREGDSWVYTNTGANGSFYNGARVDSAALKDGDIIQLAGGGPRLMFDLAE